MYIFLGGLVKKILETKKELEDKGPGSQRKTQIVSELERESFNIYNTENPASAKNKAD